MPRDTPTPATPAPLFPDVRFAKVEVMGEIAVRFALKDADEHTRAKRAVEAALKLLTDAGAMVEAKFEEPK